MSNQVKAIPEGYHTITPHLIVDDAHEAIEFYKKAFGAKELYRLAGPDDSIGHAELQIGDSRIMLADESQMIGTESPNTLGGCPVSLILYVENVDAAFNQAVQAGAKIKGELKDQFWGDRSGSLEDPFGHRWSLASHIEDVAPSDLEKRMKDMMAAQVD